MKVLMRKVLNQLRFEEKADYVSNCRPLVCSLIV